MRDERIAEIGQSAQERTMYFLNNREQKKGIFRHGIVVFQIYYDVSLLTVLGHLPDASRSQSNIYPFTGSALHMLPNAGRAKGNGDIDPFTSFADRGCTF